MVQKIANFGDFGDEIAHLAALVITTKIIVEWLMLFAHFMARKVAKTDIFGSKPDRCKPESCEEFVEVKEGKILYSFQE